MGTSGMPRPSLVKRRNRGRIERRTGLSTQMKLAAERFAIEVGSPKFAPQGHRDFRTWLAHLRTPQCRPFWERLSNHIGKEVFYLSAQVSLLDLRKAVVREVLKYVITPRRFESPNLLAMTAYRHTVSSASGNTLLSVFETQLQPPTSDDHTTANPVPTSVAPGEAVGANPDALYGPGEVPPNPRETREGEIRGGTRSLPVGLPSFHKIAALCNSH